MKRCLHSVLFSLSLAFAGNAASEETGWFLESFSQSTRDRLNTELFSPRDSLPAQQNVSLRAGYRFSPAFSVRALIRDFVLDLTSGEACLNGDFVCMAAREQSAEYASGYTVSVVPSLTLHDDLSVYGHLGLRDWNVEANGDPSVRRSELLFGIGVGYDISNPLRLQLEYRSMDLDIKLTSVGFTWRF